MKRIKSLREKARSKAKQTAKKAQKARSSSASVQTKSSTKSGSAAASSTTEPKIDDSAMLLASAVSQAQQHQQQQQQQQQQHKHHHHHHHHTKDADPAVSGGELKATAQDEETIATNQSSIPKVVSFETLQTTTTDAPFEEEPKLTPAITEEAAPPPAVPKEEEPMVEDKGEPEAPPAEKEEKAPSPTEEAPVENPEVVAQVAMPQELDRALSEELEEMKDIIDKSEDFQDPARDEKAPDPDDVLASFNEDSNTSKDPDDVLSAASSSYLKFAQQPDSEEPEKMERSDSKASSIDPELEASLATLDQVLEEAKTTMGGKVVVVPPKKTPSANSIPEEGEDPASEVFEAPTPQEALNKASRLSARALNSKSMEPTLPSLEDILNEAQGAVDSGEFVEANASFEQLVTTILSEGDNVEEAKQMRGLSSRTKSIPIPEETNDDLAEDNENEPLVSREIVVDLTGSAMEEPKAKPDAKDKELIKHAHRPIFVKPTIKEVSGAAIDGVIIAVIAVHMPVAVAVVAVGLAVSTTTNGPVGGLTRKAGNITIGVFTFPFGKFRRNSHKKEQAEAEATV